MAVMQLSPIRYGKLLAKSLPKLIETDEEFDRYVETMECLDRKAADGGLTPEEEALLALLERLVQDYDDKISKAQAKKLAAFFGISVELFI
jgi:hypothetical protein